MKQIAEGCGLYGVADYDNTISEDVSKVRLDKFAELIVQECLDACSRANEIKHFVPPTQEQVVLSCMREIEANFGVEE